jgi:hypothetical protein
VRDLAPAISPLALADFEQARLRLDRMARTVPLEEPWAAPRPARWDERTFAGWIRRNVRTGGARRLFELATRPLATCLFDDLRQVRFLAAPDRERRPDQRASLRRSQHVVNRHHRIDAVSNHPVAEGPLRGQQGRGNGLGRKLVIALAHEILLSLAIGRLPQIADQAFHMRAKQADEIFGRFRLSLRPINRNFGRPPVALDLERHGRGKNRPAGIAQQLRWASGKDLPNRRQVEHRNRLSRGDGLAGTALGTGRIDQGTIFAESDVTLRLGPRGIVAGRRFSLSANPYGPVENPLGAALSNSGGHDTSC